MVGEPCSSSGWAPCWASAWGGLAWAIRRASLGEAGALLLCSGGGCRAERAGRQQLHRGLPGRLVIGSRAPCQENLLRAMDGMAWLAIEHVPAARLGITRRDPGILAAAAISAFLVRSAPGGGLAVSAVPLPGRGGVRRLDGAARRGADRAGDVSDARGVPGSGTHSTWHSWSLLARCWGTSVAFAARRFSVGRRRRPFAADLSGDSWRWSSSGRRARAAARRDACAAAARASACCR